MSLSTKIRGGKKYRYFVVGEKRLYLGTPDNPKKERVELAIRYLHDRIIHYEQKLHELEELLHTGEKEPAVTPEIDYKLIFFDLDGVLYEKPWHESSSDKVAISTWDILFQELGMYNIHEKLKQKFESGVFKDYVEWTGAACNVLKSIRLDEKTFQNIIARRPLTQGAVDLFKELRKKGVKIAVATGSFDALAQRASKELGHIDYILAHCKLNFNKEGLLESWKLENIDYEDKSKFVEEIANKVGIPLGQCAYVGDDVNDLEAFKKVGLAIAFNSKKSKVWQAAHVVIESRDLRSILPHLYVAK